MKLAKKKTGRLPAEHIGKDEMNLLEYCVFSASKNVDRDTKSLLFEDEVYCNIEKRKVKRKLTVAFSAQYGRPTVSDDMLLVALMKKTRDLGFENQRVHFTRYELIRMLDWPDNGQSYSRIDDALNRLIGTHLIWNNAFWDNEAKSWVDRKFSIIDDAHLYDREKYQRTRANTGESSPQSWFKWSDVMFDSFQAGYIKTIDLKKLNSLKENVGKRLYRWLDKHFKNPRRSMPVEIKLSTLTNQKLGFKHAPASHLKRMLRPAISELEQKGIVATDGSRFQGRGKNCTVRFRPYDGKAGSPTKSVPANSSLLDRLIEHGFSGIKARQLAAKPEVVLRQLSHLEYLKSTGKAIKSEAAWLTQAIKMNYELPSGMKRPNAVAKRSGGQPKSISRHKATEHNQRKKRDDHENRISNYLQSLTGSERKQLETNAIKSGSKFLSERLEAAKKSGDEQFAQVYREKMVCDLVEQILDSTKM